jgi:hypothetical protein
MVFTIDDARFGASWLYGFKNHLRTGNESSALNSCCRTRNLIVLQGYMFSCNECPSDSLHSSSAQAVKSTSDGKWGLNPLSGASFSFYLAFETKCSFLFFFATLIAYIIYGDP